LVAEGETPAAALALLDQYAAEYLAPDDATP